MDDESPSSGDGERAASRARDTCWVRAALDGDQRAFGRLYDAWFDRVYNLARGIVRDDEVAADVTQDTFLAAWKNLGTLEDVDAFGGWLLRIARNTSFNRHKKEGRSSPVDDQAFAVIEATGSSPVSAPSGFGVEERLGRLADPSRMAEDGEMVVLVREAAAALGERDAEVLDLQMRYGLSPAEIGEVMGMNRNAANQLCHRIRNRFATAVRARVLWRGDRPACETLDGLLRAAGVMSFDAEAVRLADKHAPTCVTCSERRETRLEPTAMFAAIPIAAAPVLFKAKAAGALEAAGVPMSGSSFSGGAMGSTGAAGSGIGAGGPGQPGDPDGGSSDDASPRRRRAKRVAAMSLVAAVLLALLVAVLSEQVDDGTVGEELAVGGSDTSQSTLPANTGSLSIEITEDTAVEMGPATSDGVIVVDPANPDPEPSDPEPTDSTTTTTPPLRVDFRAVSPAPFTLTWLMVPADSAPRVEWLVTGGDAARVTITPPPEDTQTVWATINALEGLAAVCPNPNLGPVISFCTAPGVIQDYVYTLRVYDAADNLLQTATATIQLRND